MNNLEYLRKATSDYKQTADALFSMFDEFLSVSDRSGKSGAVKSSDIRVNREEA